MIIEIKNQIDSRFIMYDFINIIKQCGSVRVVSRNNIFEPFNGDQLISTTIFDEDKDDEPYDAGQFKEDYVLLDNVEPIRADLSLYFIDPYSGWDLSVLPAKAVKFRIMKGCGKKINMKQTAFIDEEMIMLRNLLKDKNVILLSPYEDIFKFEQLHSKMPINATMMRAISSIKKMFPNGLKFNRKENINKFVDVTSDKILW